MLNKAYKVLMIIFVIVAAASASILGLIAGTFSANRGEIPGTGFIYQEMSGTCSSSYFDVDSKDNAYFAISKMFGNYVTVYDPNGAYLYTLDVRTPGTISVRIDNNDNINVYDVKAEIINVYNQQGQLINTIEAKDLKSHSEYFNRNSAFEKPDGKLYRTDGSALTVTANGKTTVLYRKPFWQVLDELAFGILLASFALLIAAHVIKFAVPMAIARHEGKK